MAHLDFEHSGFGGGVDIGAGGDLVIGVELLPVSVWSPKRIEEVERGAYVELLLVAGTRLDLARLLVDLVVLCADHLVCGGDLSTWVGLDAGR